MLHSLHNNKVLWLISVHTHTQLSCFLNCHYFPHPWTIIISPTKNLHNLIFVIVATVIKKFHFIQFRVLSLRAANRRFFAMNIRKTFFFNQIRSKRISGFFLLVSNVEKLFFRMSRKSSNLLRTKKYLVDIFSWFCFTKKKRWEKKWKLVRCASGAPQSWRSSSTELHRFDGQKIAWLASIARSPAISWIPPNRACFSRWLFFVYMQNNFSYFYPEFARAKVDSKVYRNFHKIAGEDRQWARNCVALEKNWKIFSP